MVRTKRNPRPIFVSYSTVDQALAESFSDWIKRVLDVEPFLAGSSITLGSNWRDDLNAALDDCDVGVALMTPASLTREWIHYEAGVMSQRRIPLIPVCFWTIRKDALPSTLSVKQACDWPSEDDRFRLVSDLARILKVQAHLGPARKLISEPPFGLSDMPQHMRYGLSGAYWIPTQPKERNARFADALAAADPQVPFRLVATSGAAYLKPSGGAWENGFGTYMTSRRPFEVVLQSPFCQFAFARACASGEVRHHWDIEFASHQLKELAKGDLATIRVTDLPINASFFLTNRQAFFDPYVWGVPDGAKIVEKNFWVFEFAKTAGNEDDGHSLLVKHFMFLWRHGVPLAEFLKRNDYAKRSVAFRREVQTMLAQRAPG